MTSLLTLLNISLFPASLQLALQLAISFWNSILKFMTRKIQIRMIIMVSSKFQERNYTPLEKQLSFFLDCQIINSSCQVLEN